MAAGMAGDGAGLLDFQQHHVFVAVEPDLEHFLHVAGLFALVPQLLARAAPVHGLAQFDGFMQRIAVHPGKHQHVAGCRFLGDHRHQAVFVPADFLEPFGIAGGNRKRHHA